jgi:hypothetical protein
MEWTRTETIALAKQNCTQCHGVGLRLGKKTALKPCNCVLRSIFRICFNRFRYCASKEKYLSRVSMDFSSRGPEGRNTWGRKDEEYVADFVLVARRTLSEEEYKIFSFHYLLGADWKLCCRKMKVDRGTFFHAVYRIEQKLGQVFRELQPYALYPVDEYFSTTSAAPVRSTPQNTGKVVPIRPVLRKVTFDDIPEKQAA